MIEINLLPNARKRSRASSSAKFDFGAFMGNLSARFQDPWLGVAVGGVLLGVVAIGAMWFCAAVPSAKSTTAASLPAAVSGKTAPSMRACTMPGL